MHLILVLFIASCSNQGGEKKVAGDTTSVESTDTLINVPKPDTILTKDKYQLVSSLSNKYVNTYAIKVKSNEQIRSTENIDSVYLNPHYEEIKAKPIVIFYQDEERRGWVREYDVKRNMSNIEPSSQASSLEVRMEGWVTFYSKSHFGGSELYVRGPFYIPELRQISKFNKYGLDGNWSDEIASFKFEPLRPEGDGTYVNDDKKPSAPPQPFPCKEGLLFGYVFGYKLVNAGTLTYFYIYDDGVGGCTKDIGQIKTADIVSTQPWIGSCTLGPSYQVYVIRYCYQKQ